MTWRAAVLSFVFLCASPWTLTQDNNQPIPHMQTSGKHQEKHSSAKDDVQAIGNRKIGNKGFGNWYSLESEVALGKEYARAVESSVKLLRDPVINEYVNGN